MKSYKKQTLILLILFVCFLLSATSQIFAQRPEAVFNKKPIEDFGNKYGNLILNREIDTDAPFEIKVQAKLNEKGNLVDSEIKIKEGSDAKMTEFGKDAVKAFSDSGSLKYLYDLGGRNVSFLLLQNEESLNLVLDIEIESENKAKMLLTTLNVVLKNINFKKDSADEFLMSKTSFSSRGKSFIINLSMSKSEKNSLINKNIAIIKDKQ